jgi:hypothetical protein
MNGVTELDAYIAAGSALLGIPVRPEWRDTIRQHLEISLDLARVVQDFPLSDESEPASVFVA